MVDHGQHARSGMFQDEILIVKCELVIERARATTSVTGIVIPRLTIFILHRAMKDTAFVPSDIRDISNMIKELRSTLMTKSGH